MKRQNLNQDLTQLIDRLVDRGMTLEQAREQFERQFIITSIQSNRGNLSRSAESLGVHRNTLRNKVSRLGIESKDLSRGRSGRARSRANSPDRHDLD